MLYFQHDENGTLRAIDEPTNDHYISRHDFKTFEDAERIAKELNDGVGSTRYVATDGGSHTWPRYDVIALPQVGDVVSKGFNGDYYPCGTIVTISPTYRRITTSNGTVFYRKGHTGSWRAGSFSMVGGVHDRLNPSF